MLEEQLWYKRFESIQKYSDCIKGSSYELESIFDIAKVAKDLRIKQLADPRGKYTVIILVKEYNNEVTPNGTLLYP